MAWWIAITVLGRLIIHAPDATPTTTLALCLPVFFPLRRAIFMMIAALIISDFLLHCLFHYPAVGSWSFFTYTAWMSIIVIGYYGLHQIDLTRMLFFSTMGSLFFWIWTNFGTWCTTTLYPHTFSGLMLCYVAAIPFLKNAVVAGALWGVLFVFLFNVRVSSKPAISDITFRSDRNARASKRAENMVL